MEGDINRIDEHLDLYLDNFSAWVYPRYSVTISYLGLKSEDGLTLLDASIIFNPLPFPEFELFSIETEEIVAGQIAYPNLSQLKLEKLRSNAINGKLDTSYGTLALAFSEKLSYFTELINRQNWYSDLHLRVTGNTLYLTNPVTLTRIDNSLRCASLPFDGLADLCRWLGLNEPYTTQSSITLRGHPPVDLILQECSLQSGRLKLTIHAVWSLKLQDISLSIRPVPGKTSTRVFIQQGIIWKRYQKGIRQGSIEIELGSVDSVLVVLMLKKSLVRRHWFEDPARAVNYRLITAQSFDKDLKDLKQALSPDGNESRKFEKAVSSLMYILGFTQTQPLGTDGPDIIASTPRGRIILVECTLKISDAHTKIGKLVQRRGAVQEALRVGGHSTREVIAILVCALTKDQIPAVENKEWYENKILLVTKPDLEELLLRAKSILDPDELLDEVINSNSPQSELF